MYVNPEQHGDRARQVASSLLAKLERAKAPSDDAGDASLLPRQFDEAREADVIRTFGESFARELARAPAGKWSGPIASPYGLHLVRLSSHSQAREPKLEEVRDLVTREWLREQQESANEAFYANLRKRYRVVIEQPTSVTASATDKQAGAE